MDVVAAALLPAVMSAAATANAQLNALLCVTRKEECVRLITENGGRYSMAVGSVALHVLANIAAADGTHTHPLIYTCRGNALR